MNKRFIILMLCVVFLLGVSAGTAAATAEQEEIKAFINYGLQIKLDGNDFAPVNEDGSPMYPITYNGRTYLPVRALGNALSVAVDYDPKTQTVYLGEKGRIPLKGEDYKKNYTSQFTTDTDQLFVNGEQYQWGIVYTGTADHYEYSGFVYPNGKYQKFCGIACMEDMDETTDEVIIKIRENDYQGRVLKEITVKNGESISFEIDIPQIKTLYIQNLVSDRSPKSTNPDIMMIAEPYFN